jgi:uncharacterized protein YjdB
VRSCALRPLSLAGLCGLAVACLSPLPVATRGGPLAVTPPTASLAVGDTVHLTATVPHQGSVLAVGMTVTWTSSDTSVASVTRDGLVTAVGPGSATITATSDDGSGTAVIIVRPRAPGTVNDLAVDSVTDSSVVLVFTEVADGMGRPAQYDVRYAPTPIAWGATPVRGATISAKRTCTVLGLAAATQYDFQLVAFRGVLRQSAVFGELSNIATATTGGSTAPVASVMVTPSSVTLIPAQTRQLQVTLRDARGNLVVGRPVAWTSSATNVATVSSSGLVTAVALGNATVTAASEGHSDSALIHVVPTPPPVTYYRTNFNDGTTGPLDVYAYGGGSCAKSTDYTDSGSAYSIKCTIPGGPGGGAAALQAWFGQGSLTGAPKDPTLDQDLFEEVRFVLAPGAAAAIGGTSCTTLNPASQFKVHKSVYGQAGSAWNGWVMSDIGPCTDGNIGLFSEPEMWNINGKAFPWPGTFPSLHEGSVYDVVYRYHRYTAQGCGTIAIWVNGTVVMDSPCWSYMGTTNGSAQGLLFWDGATYLQNGLTPLVVYNLFAQATNYPVGGATASTASP